MATFETVAGATKGNDSIPQAGVTIPSKDFLIDALEGNDTITLKNSASNFQVLGQDGRDKITAESDISGSDKFKGGKDQDTLTFKDTVSKVSVYGGQGADSIGFSGTIKSSLVSGDKGNDTIELNKLEFATVKGGEGTDSFSLTEKSEFASKIYGGQDNDTVTVAKKSTDLFIALGDDDDVVQQVDGKHTNLKIKGNQCDDSITLDADYSGKGGALYGGKGEDSIAIVSNAAVFISGDDGDDKFLITSANSEGSTIKGGAGDDSVGNAGAGAGNVGKFFIKGGAGDDTIQGSLGEDTVYGGKGDDEIGGGKEVGASSYYGDKGDDKITLNSKKASMAVGGEGADTIDLTIKVDGDVAGHTVIGGTGVDSINVGSDAAEGQAKDYAAKKSATLLTYASAADFITSNKLVDEILVDDAQVVTAEVSGELSISTSTDFSRFSVGGAGTKRSDGAVEGLIIKTASSVTGASTVTLSEDAGKYVVGIDTSAGTTSTTTIDASKVAAVNPMSLIGGKGGNTITGGKGDDALVGNAANDLLKGGLGADRISTGSGDDTVDGGSGNDTISMGTNFDQFDSIVAGDGVDTLAFTYTTATNAALAKVSKADFEEIELGAANTSITLVDGTIAAGKSLDVSFNAAGIAAGSTLTFIGTAETDGTLDITGGSGADSIDGGAKGDTITGGAGADTITGGAGDAISDVFSYEKSGTALVAGGDTITDFATTVDKIEIGDLTGITNIVAGTAANAAETLLDGTFDANFVSNGTGASATAQATFVFNTATKALTFDADGTGVAATAITIATVSGGTIVAGDITLL